MKKPLTLLYFLMILALAQAQNPVYDALKLARYIEPGSNPPRFILAGTGDTSRNRAIMKSTCEIINRYYNNRFQSCKEVHQHVGNYMAGDTLNPDYNPFLATFMSPGTVQEEGRRVGLGSLASSALSAVGGLDVTNLAYGLTDFLVKRTKQELNVAFFSHFRDILNDPKYRDLKALFPNTWDLLNVLGVEIYDYNKYLQNLREAFLTDLLILDQSLPGIIPNHQQFFDRHFGLAVGLNTACYITGGIKNQVHPGDILDQYPLDQFFKKPGENDYFNKNWSGSIQTLQLINESLRDTVGTAGNYWVSLQQVQTLAGNQPAFKIYLGLIYQMAKNERYQRIPFEHGSLVALLDSVNFDVDYPAWRNYISSVAQKVNTLARTMKATAETSGDSAKVESYAQYIKASADLFEYASGVTSLPHFNRLVRADLPAEMKTFFTIIGETADLASDLNRKNYTSAVNHAVIIYSLVQTKPLQADLHQFTGNQPNTEKLKESTETKSGDAPGKNLLENDLAASQDLLSKLARYGAFMTTVASAKSAGEVETAIETAALPSGSSRIKRETPFNVSLNAYTGLFIGYEQISGMTSSGFQINNFGVAAPVGVAISTGGHSFLGMFPKNEGHWSYSAFFSLLDLGAVASFRFQNSDSVAQVPTIKLQDIFSPGLFLSVGFPKCPLSLNIGAQVGPNLRSVSATENGTIVNKYQENVYWRFSAALVVDIPIFNFYTKSRE